MKTQLKYRLILYVIFYCITISCNHNDYQISVNNIKNKPVIDGDLDKDLEKVERIHINGGILGKAMRKGENDLSASFRCCKYKQNLYFFIEVIDDICRNYNDSLLDPWELDNVELYFSKKNKHFNSDNRTAEDKIYQLRFIYGKDRITREQIDNLSLIYAQKKTKNGYNFEILIPICNTFIDKNKKIGFNIEINDNDTDNFEEGLIKGRETIISWTNSAGKSWKETINYGTLIIK